MPASPNLSLPFILPSQAQKHVTHNEGMQILDAVVQLAVRSATVSVPPTSPDQGARHILPANASGSWSGQGHKLAVFTENTWVFHDPKPGWVAWVEETKTLLAFDGTAWINAVGVPDFQNLENVGVGTTANAANPLSVAGPATLLTHSGSNHQLKVNKAAASNSASLLFQTNWSGRAEMGTTGSDDFEIKVSSDGSTFRQALVADKDTGKVRFPSGTSGLAPAAFGNGPLSTTDYVIARGDNLVSNNTGLLGNGYNYPSAFAYDPVITPDLPASFSFSGHHTGVVEMDEMVAVDANQVYSLESYLRQASAPGDWSAYSSRERHVQYMGLICLDRDGHEILPTHHMRYRHSGTDSLTTLSAPLKPGDTEIRVQNAAGWNETSTYSFNRGILLLNYKNSHGYTYRYYSRLMQSDMFNLGQVNKTTHVITLNKPLPASMGNPDHASGTWPVGTRIANSSSGGSYKYAFYDATVVPATDTWYRSTGYIGGIDASGTNAPMNFAPGTTFARPIWLPNYSNRSGGFAGYPDTGTAHKVWFAGVTIRREGLASSKTITSGSASGSVELKVPQSNHAAGTVTLVPAARSVSEA